MIPDQDSKLEGVIGFEIVVLFLRTIFLHLRDKCIICFSRVCLFGKLVFVFCTNAGFVHKTGMHILLFNRSHLVCWVTPEHIRPLLFIILQI